MKIRCLNCMQEYVDNQGEKCPFCGYLQGSKPKESYHLHPGMELSRRYIIGTVIGFGGFGTIYKAWDQTFNKIVAIKEYYPTTFLSRIPGEKQVNVYDKKNLNEFEKGKKEFLEEARNLAKFNSHPNIVNVYDFFEENGTAYFVMEFLEGCNLKVFLQANKKRDKKIDVDTALQISQCVLNALKAIHASGIIHRDIKPANIFVCKDGTIKLIDFGGARFSDSETEKTRTVIITPGYAPAEQYQIKSKQGPYTDIYAVAAVLYEMLTGIKPEESINRKVEDTIVEPKKLNDEVSDGVSNAIMRAMALQSEIRFQTVDQFAKALSSEKPVRNADREIRYRKTKTTARISFLILIIVIAGIMSYVLFNNMRNETILEPAMLSVWIPYGNEGEEATITLFNNMTSEFLQNNEMVTIEVTAFPEKEYESSLKDALAQGAGPTVFDSTYLTSEDYEYLADLNKFFDFSLYDPDSYYFLNQYDVYFPSYKQLPLTMDVPILYKNVLLEDEEISSDNTVNHDYSEFIDQSASSYLGMISIYPQVQKDLPGIYEVAYPDNGDEMYGSFYNLWSIDASASDSEYTAALRLLYYLLSGTAQDYLTVQNNNYLPLNKDVLQVYADVNGDFDDIYSYLETVKLVGEK